MTVPTQLDLGTLARVGTALADPTRRRLLVQLIDGAGYPAEMAEDFGTTRELVQSPDLLARVRPGDGDRRRPTRPLRAG